MRGVRLRLLEAVSLVTIGLAAACSGPGEQRSITGPSAQSSAQTGSSNGGGESVATGRVTGGVPLPPDGGHVAADVTFPPRNEPLLFRGALESKYRDGLRRGAVSTYVDQEGTVVWTQEYLRYRVNLCSHSEAVTRVMRQIDGFGVQPVCGSTSSVTFPPRNEPLDFMIQLETKYQLSLRRSPGSSFVDVEGNIVWTQEYLRYRVTGCGHSDAQQRVFDQIDGRGVQPTCGGGGGNTFTGSVDSLGVTTYLITMNGTGRYQATLTWPDASIDLDLYLTTTACSTYPPTSSCLRAVSNGVGSNSESVSLSVRSGEQYRLWVDNFTSRSSSFTVVHFISGSDERLSMPLQELVPGLSHTLRTGGKRKLP